MKFLKIDRSEGARTEVLTAACWRAASSDVVLRTFRKSLTPRYSRVEGSKERPLNPWRWEHNIPSKSLRKLI